MRYRLIKPEWAKTPDDEPGTASFDGDDLSPEFLMEKNAEGYGIYYFPNYNSKPITGNYLSGRHVDVFNWVYVDMDLKDGNYESPEEFLGKLAEFEVLPTKVVTSGNGVHAFWRISDLTRERFCELQLRLIKKFKTDRSIWTVLRCMRLEGYYNTKDPNNYKLVEAETWSEGSYKCVDLVKYLPELASEEERKIVNHLRKIDGQEPEINLDDVEMDELPEKFVELLEKNIKINKLFFDEDGDKSENAWQLANILYERDFTKQEALAVIANCPKALAKGSHRLSWTASTVEKVYQGKAEFVVPSAAELMLRGESKNRKGRKVYGPPYFDCLHRGWRTQQVLTLIAGTGIGKSTATLDMFKHILQNNPDSDDIAIYFNLEMPQWEIVEKWDALVAGDSNLSGRLYVVSNEDEDGNPQHLNLQKIYWYCRDLAKSTGKKVSVIAIDHIGVIHPTIDITKKPHFGLVGDMDGAYGDLRNVGLRKMPQLIKELAKQLDAFVILQSQTTKAKGSDGDNLLGVDAAYGAGQIEFYSDYVLTLAQPLRRVHHKTELRALGYQYAKVRSKHKKDRLDTYEPAYVMVDIDTGALREPTAQEEEEFEILNKEATILRKQAEKKEEVQYKAHKGGVGKLKLLLGKN